MWLERRADDLTRADAEVVCQVLVPEDLQPGEYVLSFRSNQYLHSAALLVDSRCLYESSRNSIGHCRCAHQVGLRADVSDLERLLQHQGCLILNEERINSSLIMCFVYKH
jgi:hypothetical protein